MKKTRNIILSLTKKNARTALSINTSKIVLKGMKNPVELPIIDKYMVNHDSLKLRLGFDDPFKVLGTEIGGSVKFIGYDSHQTEISKSYTPISKINQEGFADFLIKIYFKTEQYPKGGILTQYLYNLEIGQKIGVVGPKGKLIYKGDGNFLFRFGELSYTKNFQKITFIAGGSGITPFYQIIQHMNDETHSNYHTTLLFANKSEDDILLRQELELFNENPKIDINFVLDQFDKNWIGLKGHINEDILTKFITPIETSHLVVICGPIPMKKHLAKIIQGFGQNNIELVLL